MKNIISLIDTNVIINFITKREDPYKEECVEIMRLCAEGAFEGYIAFHSLSVMLSGSRKQKKKQEHGLMISAI